MAFIYDEQGKTAERDALLDAITDLDPAKDLKSDKISHGQKTLLALAPIFSDCLAGKTSTACPSKNPSPA